MMLLAYVLPFCLLGQVWGQNQFAETEDEMDLKTILSGKGKDGIASTNKEQDHAENLVAEKTMKKLLYKKAARVFGAIADKGLDILLETGSGGSEEKTPNNAYNQPKKPWNW